MFPWLLSHVSSSIIYGMVDGVKNGIKIFWRLKNDIIVSFMKLDCFKKWKILYLKIREFRDNIQKDKIFCIKKVIFWLYSWKSTFRMILIRGILDEVNCKRNFWRFTMLYVERKTLIISRNPEWLWSAQLTMNIEKWILSEKDKKGHEK